MVKVIGITGTLGAGKDTVSKHLKQRFNCFCVKLSEVLRNEIEKKRNKLDRTVLQNSGDEMRQQYGNHVLAKVSIEYLPRDKELIVINGIRNPGEVEYLKKEFGKDFLLIAVDSLPELRFERMGKRAGSNDPKTWEEFLEMDQRDQGTNQPDYGQQVKRCMEMADVTIRNDSIFEDFQNSIRENIQKIWDGWK